MATLGKQVFATGRARSEAPVCEACGSENMVIDHKQGHLVCDDCGVIAEHSMISRNTEYRNFNESDKPTGDPTRVAAGPLGTSLQTGPGANGAIAGLRGRVGAATAERFRVAFKQIGDIVIKMELPYDVRERAQELYSAYAEANTKVTDVTSMAAASVLEATRLCRMERTLKELNQVIAPDKKMTKKIGKAHRLLTRHFQELDQKEAEKQGIDITNLQSMAEAMGGADGIVNRNHPSYHVNRFGSDLGLHARGIQVAKKVALAILPADVDEKLDHKPWHGRQPMTLTAAALFIAMLLGSRTMMSGVGQRNMQDVADVCGVAVNTIEQVYAELHPYLRHLVPSTRPPMSDEDWKHFPEPKDTAKLQEQAVK